MREVAFPNLGYSLTHDTWNEQAAHGLCILMENAYQAGLKIVQVESTDVSGAETSFSALSDYLKTWHDDNVDASAAGDSPTALTKSYIPEIAQFVALAVTGQWGLIFVLFVKVGLEYLLDNEEKELDPTTSVGESAEILKQLFGVLDEDGNIVGNRLEGLTKLAIHLHNMTEDANFDWETLTQE